MTYGPPSYMQCLQELCQTHHVGAAARIMGVNVMTAYGRANRRGFNALNCATAVSPTDGEWIGAVKTEADLAGVDYRKVLAGARLPQIVFARWRAFQRILDEFPNYSIAGLARTSGFHHSSILYGVSRLAGMSPKRVGGAPSRMTSRVPAYLRPTEARAA